MSENTNNQNTLGGNSEVDFKEIYHKLLNKWKFIAKWAGISAVIGLVVAFSIPRVYEAKSCIAPERSKGSSSGSLGALASFAGISIANLSNSDAMTPELYPTIIGSTPFLVDLFSVPVEFEYHGKKVSTDIYGYFKNYTSSPWWSSVISAPFRFLGWFMGLFREKGEKHEGYADIDTFKLTYEQADIAKAISMNVSVSVDKKTYLVSISASAQNPVVAAILCRAVSESLKKYMDDYHREKAGVDLAYYESLCAESQKEYYAAQERYARYVDANQGIVLSSRRTERERLQNEMTLKFNLYNTCAQQVQQAKAKIQQETPVFAIITPATTPLIPLKPSKSKTLIAFVFLGVVGAGCWVLYGDKVIDFFKK